MYSIAQEALNNSVKHSQAQKISVSLEFGDQRFQMQIRDDGIGFDTKTTRLSGGLGLRGMEERAQRLNGSTQVVSTPGEGTTLLVEVDI